MLNVWFTTGCCIFRLFTILLIAVLLVISFVHFSICFCPSNTALLIIVSSPLSNLSTKGWNFCIKSYPWSPGCNGRNTLPSGLIIVPSEYCIVPFAYAFPFLTIFPLLRSSFVCKWLKIMSSFSVFIHYPQLFQKYHSLRVPRVPARALLRGISPDFLCPSSL